MRVVYEYRVGLSTWTFSYLDNSVSLNVVLENFHDTYVSSSHVLYIPLRAESDWSK
jgi:hypothetical protein